MRAPLVRWLAGRPAVRRWAKRSGTLAALALTVGLLAAGCQTAPGAAAVFGGSGTIPTDTLDAAVSAALTDPTFTAAAGSRAAVVRDELSQLIQVAVVDRLAGKLGVTASSAQVAAQSAEIQAAAAQSGETLPAYLNVATSDVTAVVRELTLEVRIAAALVPADYLPQVDFAHILVASKSLADRLLAQVRRDPASFAALARRYSLDHTDSAAGGNVGFVSRPEVIPALADAVFTAAPGSYLEVHSSLGWHVVHVIARRTLSPTDLPSQLVDSEGIPRLQQALRAEVQSLHIVVNPRFGQWNASNGEVVALPDTVSSPTPSPSPSPSPSPPPVGPIGP